MAEDRQILHSGGCQCGAVRYALYAEPYDTHICHCRMSQKAFGAFYAPLRLSGRWPDCQGFCGVRDFDEPQPDPGISRPDFEPLWFM